MSFSAQQIHEIRTYLGTMHYVSKKARRNGLYFIEHIVAQAIAAIEESLKKGKYPESVEQIMDSDFIHIMQFTDLLSKTADDVLEAFLEDALKEEEYPSDLKTKTSFL